MSLPKSIKVIIIVLQHRFPAQVILICVQLIVKPTLITPTHTSAHTQDAIQDVGSAHSGTEDGWEDIIR